MLPGLTSDPEKLGVVSSIKAHDTKRFRVRAVSSEGEIYERFFSKFLGSTVSWVQLGLSIFVMLAQVTVMVKLIGHQEFYGSNASVGGGVWSSVITIIAAVITMWASHKAAYGRLHASMALHIFSLIGQIFAIMLIFSSGLYQLKRSMRELKDDSYDEYYSNRYYGYEPTTATSIDMNAKRAERNLELYKLFHDTLILNAMMGVAGISQALMSFFMSLATGRAICCGRTHLEGKFLEMEAVGREDANAVVNFRAKESSSSPSSPIEKASQERFDAGHMSGRDSVNGPPPYSSGLFDHEKC